MVTVYRGAYGTCLSIKIRELVVGDIVNIQSGDRVPADCILIEEMNITVDQSIYNPRDPKEVKVEKSSSKYFGKGADNHQSHPDPFLLSDSKVMTGQGKAIVCCVGDCTLLARNRKPKDLIIEE
jgi:magnesium-transporting ATPase (P-type)